MTDYTDLKARLSACPLDVRKDGNTSTFSGNVLVPTALLAYALAAIEELERERDKLHMENETMRGFLGWNPEQRIQSMGGSSDAGSASAGMWIAEAGSRKVEPATSVKDTDCLNLFVAPVLAAACRMDWQQVILNGGPPCFHVEANGCFCLRAERWAGHQSDHDYVSLASLLVSMDPQPAQADEAREIIADLVAIARGKTIPEYDWMKLERADAYLARTGGKETK